MVWGVRAELGAALSGVLPGPRVRAPREVRHLFRAQLKFILYHRVLNFARELYNLYRDRVVKIDL